MKLSIRTVSSNPPYFSLAVTCTIRLTVLHSRPTLFCVPPPVGLKLCYLISFTVPWFKVKVRFMIFVSFWKNRTISNLKCPHFILFNILAFYRLLILTFLHCFHYYFACYVSLPFLEFNLCPFVLSVSLPNRIWLDFFSTQSNLFS